jgi:UDP-glucose 4-epimerase
VTRFLVTGGCGFIGSHLAERLIAAGHDVRILDNLSTGRRAHAPERAELVIGDVTDAASVAAAMREVDGCFHLAAVASVALCNSDAIATNRTNLVGTLSVLAAAVRHGVPVVYASSAAVYGANAAVPLAETSEPRPLSVYAADKLACELHAAVASHLHGIPTVGLRFFNVYGPRQDPASPYSGVISIFADRLARRRELTVFGDGGQVRDFVFVGDVVEALVAAMARPRAGASVCNVCTGAGTTITALAEILADIIGVPARLVHAPARSGDVRLSIGDPQRLIEAYGHAPATGLRDGLIQWLRPGDAVRPEPPRSRRARAAPLEAGTP